MKGFKKYSYPGKNYNFEINLCYIQSQSIKYNIFHSMCVVEKIMTFMYDIYYVFESATHVQFCIRLTSTEILTAT